jgi:hypothetical protein
MVTAHFSSSDSISDDKQKVIDDPFRFRSVWSQVSWTKNLFGDCFEDGT